MKKTITERFSAAMKWAIDHHGVVQKEFAEQCGVSSATITDYKYGRRSGDEETREKMAKNLGYDYRDFLALGQWILDGNDGKDWKPSSGSQKPETKSWPIREVTALPFTNKAAVEIAEWIEEESGLIDYGEVVKGVVAREFPAFMEFLKKRAEGGGPQTVPRHQDRKVANGNGDS